MRVPGPIRPAYVQPRNEQIKEQHAWYERLSPTSAHAGRYRRVTAPPSSLFP
jgi:hypothetical protein